MPGRFILPKQGLVLPNLTTNEGEEAYLKMIFRADVSDVSSGGNFYIGLCDYTPSEDDTLADVSGEPAVANGYARIAVERNSTGWPTIDLVGGNFRALTKEITFTASSGSIGPFSRLFLCNASSGTTGVLFAVSAALQTTLTLADTEAFPFQYEFFLS